MTKRILGALALLLIWTALPARAQQLAVVNYVMPTAIDPFFLDFTFDGEAYNVSGLQLLSALYTNGSAVGGGGVEVRVPHTDNSGIEFYRFEVTTDYTGDIAINPVGPPPIFITFKPWVDVPLTGGHQVEAQTGSALVGQPSGPLITDPRYYGHFEVTGINFTGVDDFANSTVTIRGFAVPEPGSTSAVACLVLSGALALRWKRRRS